VDRDRVIGYLAALTDQEYAALQSEARPPAPIAPGDTAAVRKSLAAKSAQLLAVERDANGTIGGWSATVAARQPAPQPEPVAPQVWPPASGYTGSSSLRRTPFVTPPATAP
jgi:hypothetical protein